MLNYLKKGIVLSQYTSMLVTLVSLLFWSNISNAMTVTHVLHAGNEFSVEIAPGVTIQRTGGSSGPISISNAIWQLNTAEPGEEPDIFEFSSLGGTRFGAPISTVQSSLLFETIVGDDSFTTQLIYWNQNGVNDVFAPGFESFDLSGFTNPVAALTLTAIPIPASIGFFGSACLSLLIFRRSKTQR